MKTETFEWRCERCGQVVSVPMEAEETATGGSRMRAALERKWLEHRAACVPLSQQKESAEAGQN